MRTVWLSIALFAGCGASTAPVDYPETCPGQVIQHPSVAVLDAGGKPACTAWAWDADNVVTAAHCVGSEGDDHQATWQGRRLRVAHVWHSDRGSRTDLAVLRRLDGLPFRPLQHTFRYQSPDEVIGGGGLGLRGVQRKPVSLQQWPVRRTRGCLVKGDSGAPALSGGVVVGVVQGGHPGNFWVVPLAPMEVMR